jgi:hypothetical protein
LDEVFVKVNERSVILGHGDPESSVTAGRITTDRKVRRTLPLQRGDAGGTEKNGAYLYDPCW